MEKLGHPCFGTAIGIELLSVSTSHWGLGEGYHSMHNFFDGYRQICGVAGAKGNGGEGIHFKQKKETKNPVLRLLFPTITIT